MCVFARGLLFTWSHAAGAGHFCFFLFLCIFKYFHRPPGVIFFNYFRVFRSSLLAFLFLFSNWFCFRCFLSLCFFFLVLLSSTPFVFSPTFLSLCGERFRTPFFVSATGSLGDHFMRNSHNYTVATGCWNVCRSKSLFCVRFLLQVHVGWLHVFRVSPCVCVSFLQRKTEMYTNVEDVTTRPKGWWRYSEIKLKNYTSYTLTFFPYIYL